VLRRVSFVQLVVLVAVVAVTAGIVGYVASGTTTNVGTTTAIGSENAKILAAEHESCKRDGHYASLATLEHDGLLGFKPIYNSVVYIPGAHCGTIVVGSPSYQSGVG
jgi:hypothetical protein